MDRPSTSGSSFKKKNYSLSCFVPLCPSTSTKFPDKIFVSVPKSETERTNWMKAARRDPRYIPSPNSVVRCCEDHFDMENDVENWVRYKLMGGRIILKKGVVPHIFECQGRQKPLKSSLIEKERQEANEPSTARLSPQEDFQNIIEDIKKTKDKSVQVAMYPYKRSKGMQVAITTPHRTVALSPKKPMVKHQFTSPMKVNRFKLIYSDSDSESLSVRSSNLEIDGETESTTESFQSEESLNKIKQTVLKLTMDKIMAKPKSYIGIPIDCIFILDLLQKSTQLPVAHICLILRKLKLNEPFSILADDFGYHESTVSRIFSCNLPTLAQALEKFIIKPTRLSVLDNLPVAFRDSYFKTYCIIDCLEIEIETPTNALHQTLTYSSYKKCNTLKYLISATPAGIVNFISKGFGGRTSDLTVFEKSTFLDNIPPGVSIMSDRGFKHIERVLLKKNIKLEKPPSVKSKEKSSRADIVKTKKIASLRIHIERVIRRLREFSFLKPHSCIDHHLVSRVDDAILICCALINLQPLLVQ